MAEHTPTPWLISPFGEVLTHDRKTVFANNFASILSPGELQDQALANTAFIVEAVNNYEALKEQNAKLVEALEPFADDELHEGLDDGPDEQRTGWPRFKLGELRRARSEFLKAKGGA